MDTQAIILAGGQGTRLRPLTDRRPKPIVPVLNRPFLCYQLALLRQHSVTDVILSCSYRVDDVRVAMASGAEAGVTLRYAVETDPLGTAGGVRNAADLAGGRLIVLNGDILTDLDLSAMLRFHAGRGARTTIALTTVDDPTRYGLIETDASGSVRRFIEKPRADRVTTHTVNAGIYVIEPDLLRRIPPGRPVSIEREFFPALLADGVPTFGFTFGGYWRDIGSPAAYREAHRDLLDGRVATPVAPNGARRDGCWIAADARIDPGVILRGPTVIGAAVRARAGASLGPHAVIGDRSRIAARASIEGAILWEGVEVGEDSVLRGCVVGDGSVIGARVSAGAGVILEAGARVAAGTRLPR